MTRAASAITKTTQRVQLIASPKAAHSLPLQETVLRKAVIAEPAPSSNHSPRNPATTSSHHSPVQQPTHAAPTPCQPYLPAQPRDTPLSCGTNRPTRISPATPTHFSSQQPEYSQQSYPYYLPAFTIRPNQRYTTIAHAKHAFFCLLHSFP